MVNKRTKLPQWGSGRGRKGIVERTNIKYSVHYSNGTNNDVKMTIFQNCMFKYSKLINVFIQIFVLFIRIIACLHFKQFTIELCGMIDGSSTSQNVRKLPKRMTAIKDIIKEKTSIFLYVFLSNLLKCG